MAFETPPSRHQLTSLGSRSTMDPRHAYMEMVVLDKQLRDLLRAHPLNVQDANVLRRRLMDAATRLTDTHIEFAVFKEVELALWKPCFYRRIEDFRRRIRKYAAAAQTDRNVREHFARVSNEFQQFLTEASAFYTYLSNVFATWLQKNQSGAAVAEGSDVATNIVRCRQSLHRCYVFLGDLARYRELHSQKVKKNFAAAEALYHRALTVLPENGNPHNQLAVLATYVEAETVAVYHYCRSLLTSQPFTTAEENLALLFERTRQRPLAAPITLKTSSPLPKEKSALLKSYLHRLTRMHGILFALSSPHGSLTASSGRASSNDLTAPMYPRDMEAVLFKDMRLLLDAGVVGDALLLKVVVTNIFCIIRASDSRSQSAPIEDALRLSIRTITCVMEFLLDSFNVKPKTEASDKTLALRLSGTVAIFCDFLKLHPDMLEQLEQLLVHRQKKLFSEVTTNDQGAGADQFAFVFLETLAKLVNHARIRELYAPLVSNAGQHNDDGLPFAVRGQQHLLKENLELRGFAPLEEDGTASTWQDERAVQTLAAGANSTSQVTPLSDDEAAKIRAWRLYHFARYLCDGYEGNPLLFCSASGQFTTSPLAEKGLFQQNSGTTDGLASLSLGFLSTDNIKQQPSQAQEAFGNGYQADSGVDEDDDFDDEVIVFRPSPALKGMSGNESTKQQSGYATAVPSPLDTLSGGGTFSLRAPSPISPLDGQGASVSSQSNAFGSGHGSFGSSLGYPSFNTFNDVGSLSSEPLMSGWGNSANSNNTNGKRNDNDNDNDNILGRGLGLPFRGLDTGFMTSLTTSGGMSDAQSHGFSSRVGDNRPFAPMADLAAVERESALYQQRTSSLSAFLGALTPASQTETHSSSPSRMPARPPPGFAATLMRGQQ